MKKILLTFVSLYAVAVAAQPRLTEGNIKEVVAAMTLEEKANLLVGSNRQYECPPWAAPGMPKREEPDWNKINAENKKQKEEREKIKEGNAEPQDNSLSPLLSPLSSQIVTSFTSGRVQGAASDNIPVERLGVPAIIFADGPAGLRIDPFREEGTDLNTQQGGKGAKAIAGRKTYYCTAFPTGCNLAATWNPALVEETTRAMGSEVREYGVDVLLAPAMNIARNPLCGRNFEYFGEDPLLSGKMAAAYIRGLQSEGVGASLKHFAVNNQETWRNGVNVIVSDRAMREIYLKGFEIAVKESQPWTIMSSYNKINGVLASENRWLLTDLLRKEWGFKGSVVTDWWAEENGYRQILAGNDLLMPGSKHQYNEIVEAVKDGRLDERQLDWCVENVLRLIVETPTYAQYKYSDAPDLQAHALASRKAAEESIVLLENNGALPLKRSAKVVLFGVSSYDLLVGGSGSGNVNRAYKVSLHEGLSGLTPLPLSKERGVITPKDDIANTTIGKETQTAKHSTPLPIGEGQGKGLSVEGLYLSYIKANKDSSLENFWAVPVLEEIKIEKAMAERAARQSDVAILTIGRMAGEGGDRKLDKGDYFLSDLERDNLTTLCAAFHARKKKVVVVLDMGGVIDMADWHELPDAIVYAGLAGQEMGNALADVLTGKVTPSGKLPMTFAQKYEDYSSARDFPSSEGIDGEVRYREDIYVGYRHFDTHGVKPLYPFGHGKSYTTFAYSNATVEVKGDSIVAKVTVTNTGKCAGKESVQLYASAPQTSMKKPVKELRAFSKTALLQPRQSETLTMTLAKADLASWDNYEGRWLFDDGEYKFLFAASAENIKETIKINIECSPPTSALHRETSVPRLSLRPDKTASTML